MPALRTSAHDCTVSGAGASGARCVAESPQHMRLNAAILENAIQIAWDAQIGPHMGQDFGAEQMCKAHLPGGTIIVFVTGSMPWLPGQREPWFLPAPNTRALHSSARRLHLVLHNQQPAGVPPCNAAAVLHRAPPSGSAGALRLLPRWSARSPFHIYLCVY